MSHTTRIVLFISLVSLSSCISPEKGKEDYQAEVDSIIAGLVPGEGPGCAVAIVRDGKIFYTTVRGFANLEYGIPVTRETPFHVASVSKQFTTFAILLLEQDGKLSLDDDIRKHLPTIPEFDQTITIRHLATHTSGIRDQWELLATAGWRLDDVITQSQIIRTLEHQQDLNFKPGSEFLYCNSGFTLLAEIVATVSGQSFPEFCKERIFEPLEMTNTHFHDDHQMIVKNRAYSYSLSGDSIYKKSVLSYANAGATSLFTTAEDLGKWLINLETGNLGGQELLDKMHQRGILNNGDTIDYSLGLSHGTYRGLSLIGHSGGDAGFRSYAGRFPDQRLGIVVLQNVAHANPSALTREIATVFLKEQMDPEEEQESTGIPGEEDFITVDPETLKQYQGFYELQYDLWVKFFIPDDRLWIEQGWNGKKNLLSALSETRFYIEEEEAYAVFGENDEKEVTLTIEFTEDKLTGKRISEGVEGFGDLEEYEGSYYSDELGTVYDLTLQNDTLVATHRRHEDIKLIQTREDTFRGSAWWFRKLEFQREGEEITGFLLSGSRVRQLRFRKQ
jgi:CubicO group peptidase (beta-lactamase class C family)